MLADTTAMEGISPSRPPASEPVIAETVYLLLTKEHRISKHLRAKWYMKHVNTTMEFPYHEENPGHPRVVSVLVKGNQPLRPAPDGTPVKFKLATNTDVNFLCSHHDLVFAIDVSFSAISSSTADSEVLFDTMLQSLRRTMVGLTKTFIIPGTDDMLFVPYIYATVIAYCPIENCPTHQVLTHGYLVSYDNVDKFTAYVSLELNKFENGVAMYMKTLSNSCRSRKSSIASGYPSVTTDDCDSEDMGLSLKDQHLSPEKAFFHLLKNALLAIHLLPSNCSSGIIVITDGNVGIGDVGRYDNLLVQLLSQSCTCSVIEVQCCDNEKRGLGRVPHSELLEFIATATFGAYFDKTPDMEADTSQEMNVYHKGVLSWFFKKSIQDIHKIGPSVESLTYEKKMRRKYTTYQLNVPINCVITTRLKEGFTIKNVDASKENFIEVILVLPWRKNIRIEYKAGSVWPVPATNPITQVEIYYEGNYHFLHDLICKKAHIHTNSVRNYRNILVSRFWKCLLSLKTTDDSLVMMQSFHTQEEYSSIPDSISKGVALFGSTVDSKQTRTLDIISSNKDTDVEQFASYWRHVLRIDLGMPLDKSGLTFERSSHIIIPDVVYSGAYREKWFHITKLHMVLEHDPKHPESLNIPISQDRYQGLLVRQAYQALTKLLRDWNDFELLENSHYVKYIHRQDNDTTPISGYHAENWISFCMMMLSIKDACVTLRLTFLGGTDSIYRTRMINDLNGVLESLRFPKTITKVRSKKPALGDRDSSQHKPPLQLSYDERACCNLVSKPLDRVLVRYERIPEKLLTVDNINRDIAPLQGVPSRLANYLHHQRWVWYLQPSSDSAHFDPLDIRTIGNILNVITSIRLQEGFHFSHTNSGIVSMILQVDMSPEGSPVPADDQASLSCLVQYVTFPPQRRSKIHDCVSESEVDEEVADTGGSSELTMVTEVWIEPQHGFVSNGTPERLHYDGCTFSQWPDRLLPVDQRCITLLATLEHLLKYCSPVSRTSMSSSLVSGRLEKLSTDCHGDGSEEEVNRVKQVPFTFSIIELLPMCQQVEMLLPTYCTSISEVPTPRSCHNDRDTHKANEIFFTHLFDALDKHQNSYEMELTSEECNKLMAQVQSRDRDPVIDPLCFQCRSSDTAVHTDHSMPDGLAEQSTTTSSSNLSRGGSLVDQQQSGPSTDRTTASSHQVSDETTIAEEIASWRCYCFPSSPDNQDRDPKNSNEGVSMLFVPATYKNLVEICTRNYPHRATESSGEGETTDDSNYMTSSDRDLPPGSAVPPLNLPNSPTPQSSSQSTPSMTRHNMVLPIYLYHCTKKQIIDCLINNSTDNVKKDEYIDLRLAQDDSNGREYRTSYRSDKSDESETFVHPNRRRYRTESTCSRRSLTRAASMDLSCTDGNVLEISSFCEEIFLKSYITGIFTSLQKNYNMSSHDIESAISICEESTILEIQLTDFLKHICSHMSFQATVDSSSDQVFVDTAPTTPKSVKFEVPGLTAINDSESANKQKRSSGSSDQGMRPSNLRSPLTVRIPCSALFEKPCDSKASSERIKAKFYEVLGKWFKPVPSCKDVYYYCPPTLKQQMLWISCSDSDNGSEKLSAPDYDTEDVEMFETEDEDGNPDLMRQRQDHRLLSTSASVQSTHGSSSAILTKPLFVHLTASVLNERVNMPVKDIPVCLCELQEGFKKREYMDLQHAQVSLDIICLTLPRDETDDIIEEQGGDEVTDQLASPANGDFMNVVDMDEALSEVQREHVKECKDSIEWLVRDEIAAAMRSTGVITEDTLAMVAEHVKNSVNEVSCKYAKETLNYVFGPGKSHEMFLEEFKSINVTGYQLIERGDYYYLSIDRARLRTHSVRHDVLHQLGDVAHILDEMKGISDCPVITPLSQSESCASRALDRSIEILPGGRESSRISLARAASLPGPELHSLDWPPNFHQRTRSSSKVKSTASDGESSDSVAIIDDEMTGPIPIAGSRPDRHNDDCDEDGMRSSYLQETLSSLPQRNQIDEWNREEEDFASKCGSLPKAFSSSNVNLETNGDRKTLKRVSSVPQEFDVSDSKPKLRHASEDTGRKRATFADSVTSPPTNSSHLMTMREVSELEAARSRNTSGPWTPGSNRINGSTGSDDDSSYEHGYEADFSDDEGTGGGLSLIESSRTPLMPDFWLIMQVHSDRGDDSQHGLELSSHRLGQAPSSEVAYRVDVFFHTSEGFQQERHFSDSISGNVPKTKLFSHVSDEIKKTCKLVNQRLLLQDLHSKRRCDPLLEEDWDDDTFASETRHKPNTSDSDGEIDPKSEDKYLYARTKFKQGHFKCDLKWEKIFCLHPRLKTGKNKLSTRGVSALKTALNNWTVINRTNMFVWKENEERHNRHNIFYFRLSECGDCGKVPPAVQQQDSVVEESRSSVSAIHDAAPFLSRSSSVRSMSRLREESDSSRRPSITGDNDDIQSITSKVSMYKRHQAQEDGVKLSVYGIDEPGVEIREDLVKMLESRLEKQVLNEIEMLLSRNPNCMLTPHDVQSKEVPTDPLRLSLPVEVLHYQTAVLHYLRQNLLQLESLFHPKYQDIDHKFMDYTKFLDNASPMIESNTFLYNKRHNNSGLALIYLQIVDSSDQPVTLLDCPKPDMDSWRSFHADMFDRLTHVEKLPSSSLPMTTSSYVKLSMWCRGEIDRPVLEEMLIKALKHSLCDFVCEYYAFTAPLCEVPPELATEAALSIHEENMTSLNTSKGNTTPTGTRSSGAPPANKHALLGKSKSISASAFSFMDDHIRVKNQVSSPTLSFGETLNDTSDFPQKKLSVSSNAAYMSPLIREIDRYKFGEKGHLLPFYTTTLVQWLEYCGALDLPALSKVSCGLLTECIVDPIMKEFESVVRDLPGVSIQAFRLIDNNYVPYQTSRAPLAGSEEASEVGMCKHLNFPYSDLAKGHVLTVRNRKLWIDAIGDHLVDESLDLHTPLPGSIPRAKNNQKFPPAYVGMDNSASLSNSLSQSALHEEKQILPRQQFLMLVVKDEELVLYSYNLAEGNDDIKNSAKKITRWNNARYHLLNSVAHQKMGLFQHVSIHDVPAETHCTNKNVYTRSFEDISHLAKSSHPSPDNQRTPTQRPGNKSIKSVPQHQTGLDRIYRGCKPTRPMHLSKYGLERDPITRHGMQLIECHKNEMRDNERKKKLEKLYTNWQQRIGPLTTEISEDQLELLKQSSRLVHHVATPLLLSPYWRDKAMNLPRNLEDLQKLEAEKTSQGRSRNNSGASVRSTKFPGGAGFSRDSPVVQFSARPYEEEPWHEEMRQTFVNNYIDYLRQTQQPLEQLGFMTIKIASKPVHRGFNYHHRKHSSGGSGAEQLVRSRTTDSLQKTMPGGIFLIELSFQEVYFVVKLYVFSASQLGQSRQPHYKSNHHKTKPYFIEMCDRMRDNTHCHSFAHDFHLRAVHRYVKYSKDFHPKYHLVQMMTDFSKFYEEAPRYSRNALALKLVHLDAQNNPADKLYQHILQHESRDKMRQITMTEDHTSEFPEENDNALVYHLNVHDTQTINRKYGEYEVSIIICHNRSQDSLRENIGKLNLAYFVILVNKELFPVKVPHDKALSSENFGELNHADRLSADSAISSSPCGFSQERRSSGQFAEVLQTMASSQHPGFQLLSDQCLNVKEKLTLLVEGASLQCRKNSLWVQMRNVPKTRARHYTSDVSHYYENSSRLSFEEFQELYEQVDRQPLSYPDGLLQVLYTMSIPWFRSLTRVLAGKYEHLYREFSRRDEQLIYSVVLIPEVEEAVLVISIDSVKPEARLMLMFLDGFEDSKTKALNECLSEFMNTLCFHMWSQMGVKDAG